MKDFLHSPLKDESASAFRSKALKNWICQSGLNSVHVFIADDGVESAYGQIIRYNKVELELATHCASPHRR